MKKTTKQTDYKLFAEANPVEEHLVKFSFDHYETEKVYPWKSYPDYYVLKHPNSGKWFAVFMCVKKKNLREMFRSEGENDSRDSFSKNSDFDNHVLSHAESGFAGDKISHTESDLTGDEIFQPKTGISDGEEYIMIVNMKAEPFFIDLLAHEYGYMRGYHMNKEQWISMILDGSISRNKLEDMLDMSYRLTSGKKKLESVQTGPKEWLVPANPKYYDLISDFNSRNIIEWKQSTDVKVGDIVYMYVAVPYSAILYRCEAVEVGIPWKSGHDELNVRQVMRIKMLDRYDVDLMTLEHMKEFGVKAVRGPRYMPRELKEELERVQVLRISGKI